MLNQKHNNLYTYNPNYYKQKFDKSNIEIENDNNIIQAVVLTRSGKNQGACVAAYDLNTKKIIRFVADAKTGGEIPFQEIRDISVLDIVEVKVIKDCPIGPQTENILVERNGFKRKQKYNGTIENIRKTVVYHDDHFFMDHTYYKLQNVSNYHHSLEIISVTDLIISKVVKSDNKVTTRASFVYSGKKHSDYRVTDFNYDMRKEDKNSIVFPKADLVVSIPHKNYYVQDKPIGYFKFVAAIYPLEESVCDDIIKTNVNENKDSGSTQTQQIKQNIEIVNREQSFFYDKKDSESFAEPGKNNNLQRTVVKPGRSIGTMISRLLKLWIK